MPADADRETELAQLHRSYRMMETDRQKYSEESQVRAAATNDDNKSKGAPLFMRTCTWMSTRPCKDP